MEKGKNLHLTEDEFAMVVEPTIMNEDAKTASSLSLVGTLLTNRPFNVFALQASMKGVWKIKKVFVFREINSNLFIF